jgi:apolipoprotein N-acyltransferase
LLTISNDTWFGRSAGPIQHLEIAQNRALEHQKPLVRSTNSGISAFIGKKGQIIEKQDYFEEKLLNREIMLFSGQTFYSNYGNSPLIILILSFLIIVFGYRLIFRNL